MHDFIAKSFNEFSNDYYGFAIKLNNSLWLDRKAI